MTHHRELVRFDVLRSALYHTARRRTFERWNRIFNFLVVVLGTAVVGDLTDVANVPALWAGVAVAVIGALQLVFDFGQQAREHQILQREYYNLLADIESVLDPTDQQCAEWYSALLRITANEAPIHRLVDAIAHNEAIDAMEFFHADERVVIPWHHHIFALVCSFAGHRYLKAGEARENGTDKQPS